MLILGYNLLLRGKGMPAVSSTYKGWLLAILFYLFSGIASAAITVDGNADDWREVDRLDLSNKNNVAGFQLYGRYLDNTYYLLLKSDQKDIGHFTTVWLNTDQNNATGYQIFGDKGGAEYFIDLDQNKKAQLYQGEPGTSNSVELVSAIQEVDAGSVFELAIPMDQIGLSSARDINLLLDVNNDVFLPAFYGEDNQYILRTRQIPDPIGSDEKRVGIVFSDTTAKRFWSEMSYSQLFMSVQAQAMMAGIPFDLLTEDDLLDINKVTRYQTLVFPNFSHVDLNELAEIESNLLLASKFYDVGIVTAGDFLTNQADGPSLSGDAYSRMKNLLGVQREDGISAKPAIIRIAEVEHPMTKGEYQFGEAVLNYGSAFSGYFSTTNTYPTSLIATMHVDDLGVKNAVLATTSGGRNVHFASLGIMVDANLLWSAIRWSVFGDEIPATLQISRQKALFAARNDMDQSMFANEINTTEVPLLALLKDWKRDYNFVGSYYINVGENPSAGEYTDWSVSGPLYQDYISLQNEIGTHSYNHPHNTNTLDAETLRHEFADSRQVIEQNLGLSNIGAAVPGAPEDLRTANEIIQHVSYLSGGYASTGAGFPNAFGYLTPSYDKVYFAPNMTFDFTNIQFLGLTAEQTKEKWFGEFDTLTKHASLPILHWPWHDYGPTSSLPDGYTIDMFESLIKKASDYRAEFVTVDDLRKRMESYHSAQLAVKKVSDTQLSVQVSANDKGRFAVNVANAPQMIQSVANWYAYDKNKVFLSQESNDLTVKLGNAQDQVTRIFELPSRANLLKLSGDGRNIEFTFEGEGKVSIYTQCARKPKYTTESNVSTQSSIVGRLFTMEFSEFGTHQVTVDGCPESTSYGCAKHYDYYSYYKKRWCKANSCRGQWCGWYNRYCHYRRG